MRIWGKTWADWMTSWHPCGRNQKQNRGVSVRNFRSRWGSCDKQGQVVFNWNIIKAPHAVIDYVVIHELCHLIHPNHSKEFWQLVRANDRSHVEHKKWLKERGTELLP
jgi:predicted metal-dependent hydrolase